MRPGDAARLLLLAAIWGSSYLFIKVGLEGLTPVHVVTARLGFGAVVLVAIVAVTRAAIARGQGVARALLFMAVIANIIPFLLITWGEERISSSLTAILNSTTPLFTAGIASFVVPGEGLTGTRVAGIVLGFLGVAVIVGPSGDQSALAGSLAVILASLSYGVGFVYARTRLAGRDHSLVALSAMQLSLATALLFPIALWDAGSHPLDLATDIVLAVAALGVLGTGFAYLLYYRLVQDVGATTASFVTYLVPIFAAVIGFLVLGERLGWNTLAGALLVIAGITLAESKRRRGAPETLATEGQ
jgi:drug/metabolite transporter (DMT)-like permease